MGDVLKFEEPKAEIRCIKTDLWAVWQTGDEFAILLPCKGEVVAFVLSRADTQKLGLELLNTAGSLEEAKKEALAANAELERLRTIEAAARAAHDAEKAWRENGGMNPGLAGAMSDAQAALRKVLEASNG